MKGLLTCTECNASTNHTHGERWSSKLGFIINKDENLCSKCASKRQGFKTLSTINSERKLLTK